MGAPGYVSHLAYRQRKKYDNTDSAEKRFVTF
jgi:hypothetical protein